jgi:hypothetical protein
MFFGAGGYGGMGASSSRLLEVLMTPLLVFAVLCLLTFGIMLVAAAGVLLPYRFCQTEEKSIALLRSWLTPEQLKQWTRGREFEVTGCDTGNRYRITDSTSSNVLQLNPSGHAVAKWCFTPKGNLAIGDVLLAQKIALETMERQVLAVANRCRVN